MNKKIEFVDFIGCEAFSFIKHSLGSCLLYTFPTLHFLVVICIKSQT